MCGFFDFVPIIPIYRCNWDIMGKNGTFMRVKNHRFDWDAPHKGSKSIKYVIQPNFAAIAFFDQSLITKCDKLRG